MDERTAEETEAESETIRELSQTIRELTDSVAQLSMTVCQLSEQNVLLMQSLLDVEAEDPDMIGAQSLNG